MQAVNYIPLFGQIIIWFGWKQWFSYLLILFGNLKINYNEIYFHQGFSPILTSATGGVAIGAIEENRQIYTRRCREPPTLDRSAIELRSTPTWPPGEQTSFARNLGKILTPQQSISYRCRIDRWDKKNENRSFHFYEFHRWDHQKWQPPMLLPLLQHQIRR